MVQVVEMTVLKCMACRLAVLLAVEADCLAFQPVDASFWTSTPWGAYVNNEREGVVCIIAHFSDY